MRGTNNAFFLTKDAGSVDGTGVIHFSLFFVSRIKEGTCGDGIISSTKGDSTHGKLPAVCFVQDARPSPIIFLLTLGPINNKISNLHTRINRWDSDSEWKSVLMNHDT